MTIQELQYVSRRIAEQAERIGRAREIARFGRPLDALSNVSTVALQVAVYVQETDRAASYRRHGFPKLAECSLEYARAHRIAAQIAGRLPR